MKPRFHSTVEREEHEREQKGADMMKMTENTTLAELQRYLKACGDPFVMVRPAAAGRGAHVIVHSPDGMFVGTGTTIAEALEMAFSMFRRATLPAGLKELLETAPTEPNGEDYGPQCEAKGQCEDIKGDGTCFGCGRWLGDEQNLVDAIKRDTVRNTGSVSLAEQTRHVLAQLTPAERALVEERRVARQKYDRDPAFNKFRQTADEVPEPESEHDQYDRATGDLGRPLLGEKKKP